MKSRTRVSIATIMVVGLVAAATGPAHSADAEPVGRLVADEGARSAIQRTLATVDRSTAPTGPVDPDTALLTATADIPRFGGVWRDDTPQGPVVTIAVADAKGGALEPTGSRVTARVAESLRASGESGDGLWLSQVFDDEVARIRTVSVDYTFAELKRWQTTFDPLFESGVVTLADADERGNTVTVGVADLDDRDRVIAYAARSGVPRDALHIVEAVFATTLDDDHRPVVGGQQIEFAFPIVGDVGTIFNTALCTLGVTARIVNTSPQVPGYLTNSHCSIDYAETDYVYHWQPNIPFFPSINTGNRIGYEVLDPPLYTGDPYGAAEFACPAGNECRLSDAGFGAFDGDYTSTPRGRIARIAFTGTTEWNGTDTYRVTSTGYPSGAVRAMGRTSGMSLGTITHSCFRIGIIDMPNILQNCQYAGTYSSQPGDSGGPVFHVTHSPSTFDVTLVGLNWGSGTLDGQAVGIVSAWPLALADFYPYDIRVCAAGFGC